MLNDFLSILSITLKVIAVFIGVIFVSIKKRCKKRKKQKNVIELKIEPKK